MTIRRWIGRPTLGRSLTGSFCIHTGIAASLGIVWYLGAHEIERSKFGGQRTVLQVQMAPSETEQPLVETAATSVSSTPQTVTIPDTPVTTQFECQEVTAVEPTPVDVAIQRSAPPETLDLPTPDVPPQPATQTTQTDTPTPQNTRRDVPKTRPRAMSAPTVPQIAGTDPDVRAVISITKPFYPPQAVQQRWEGVVLLRLFVSSNGNVAHVEIVRSSGYGLLDSTALETVKQWRAQPAEIQGQPVASVEVVPVRFRL